MLKIKVLLLSGLFFASLHASTISTPDNKLSLTNKSANQQLDNALSTKNKPQGELTIQTIAMPADTNMNGDIFGGWLMSQMDLAAAVIAKKTAGGRTATVGVHSISFYRPVRVGELVSCYAELSKIGNTSMTIKIEMWTTNELGEKQKVTDGVFVFVAIDKQGKPRPVRELIH